MKSSMMLLQKACLLSLAVAMIPQSEALYPTKAAAGKLVGEAAAVGRTSLKNKGSHTIIIRVVNKTSKWLLYRSRFLTGNLTRLTDNIAPNKSGYLALANKPKSGEYDGAFTFSWGPWSTRQARFTFYAFVSEYVSNYVAGRFVWEEYGWTPKDHYLEARANSINENRTFSYLVGKSFKITVRISSGNHAGAVIVVEEQ